LEALAADGFFGLSRDVSWAGALACAALVVADRGDTQGAEAVVELLDPYADQFVIAAGMPFGSVSHFLAVVAVVLGEHDRADAAFAAAADVRARMNAPAFLASTRTTWARFLLQRGRPGDAEQARRLLDEALATARQLGLAGLERDLVGLLQ
jgi:hypothetical protein